MCKNTRKLKEELLLRKKVEALGIEIKPEQDFTEDSQSMTMCAMRATECEPVLGSGKVACDSCKELVWLAPSSQEILIKRTVNGFETKTLCLPCVLSGST